MSQPNVSTIMLRWVKRVLIVTDELDAWTAQQATLQAQGVAVLSTAISIAPPESVDCIIADAAALFDGRLRASLPVLVKNGAVYVVYPAPGLPLAEATATLPAARLRTYVAWSQRADGSIAGVPMDSDDKVVVVMAVGQSYAPLDHAEELFRGGKPHWCLELLHNIPSRWLDTSEALGRAALLKLLCFVAWDTIAGPEDRLNRFCRAQREFYTAVNCLAYSPEAYFAHARLWKALGRPRMGAGLLRSLAHVTGMADAGREAEAMAAGTADESELETPDDCNESIEVSGRSPRILMVCHEHSDYGLDTLCYGLKRVLGDEQVQEFPWKPWLHGKSMEAAYSYPCLFDLPGEPHDLDWVLARLREGAFDLVACADTLCQIDRDLVRSVMAASTEIPLFILDTWDEAGDYLSDTLGHLGRASASAYFKREMIVGASYPARTFPLPFSYPDDRIPEARGTVRDIPLFWAGKRQDGHRRLLLGYLEQAMGLSLDTYYPPEEYAQALDRARIGLSLFGLGFDTVRYWELPAHGCLLLAERPPIHIPHNFQDGVSAVLFEDAADLEAKLGYYLGHPEEAERIACAGHEHFMRYHTSTARARQFLAQVEKVLGG